VDFVEIPVANHTVNNLLQCLSRNLSKNGQFILAREKLLVILSHMKPFSILILCIGLPLATLAAPFIAGHEANLTINDRPLQESLVKQAEKFLEEGKATPMAQLIEQLSRKSSSLKLPTAGKLKPLTPPEIFTRSRDAVLVVGSIYKCQKCTRWHSTAASGFFISSEGAFVTSYHVVDHADHAAMVVMTTKGDIYPVKEVLAANKQTDTAILKIDGAQFPYLPLAPEPPVGSSIYVISHPDQRFYTFTQGTISRYYMSLPSQKLPWMAITADFAKGSSGAPVLNDKGQVVGIVNSTFSTYYNVEEGKKDNLQMVFKNCIISKAVTELIELPSSTKKQPVTKGTRLGRL
jgi:serine protease Do